MVFTYWHLYNHGKEANISKYTRLIDDLKNESNTEKLLLTEQIADLQKQLSQEVDLRKTRASEYESSEKDKVKSIKSNL